MVVAENASTSQLEQALVTIETLRTENESLRKEYKLLKEQFDWLRKQIFGKKSERHVETCQQGGWLPGFEPAQSKPVKTQSVAAHERKIPTRHGEDKLSFPSDLPIETKVIDIPEKDKICLLTGKPLVKIGEEITHRLASKPGTYFIKETIRLKYALPNNEGVLVAGLPDSLFPKCRVDESFIADILTKKYADHLPLYRISEILLRDKIHVSRQLLSQWVLRTGEALEPLYEEMIRRILKSGNIFLDETPVGLQVKGQGKVHQAYMWLLAGGLGRDPPYRVYDFELNRQHSNVNKLIGNYKGVVHSDKYGAYESLAKREGIIWCPCWAHIRRHFFEAETGDPPFRAWVLRKIKYLFMFERVAWARSEEERLRIRRTKESPIIDELIKAIQNKLLYGPYLPKSKFRNALEYFCGLIPYLKNYLNHPHAHLDNNVAERAVRPLAIGRKNWLFVGSAKGGRATATILSLIQTCRGLGIDPREYLEDVFRRLLSHSSWKLHELLPDEWLKRRQQATS